MKRLYLTKPIGSESKPYKMKPRNKFWLLFTATYLILWYFHKYEMMSGLLLGYAYRAFCYGD